MNAFTSRHDGPTLACTDCAHELDAQVDPTTTRADTCGVCGRSSIVGVTL